MMGNGRWGLGDGQIRLLTTLTSPERPLAKPIKY
jgi:hypothetical protein